MLSLRTEIPHFRKCCSKSVITRYVICDIELLSKAHLLSYLLSIHCILRFYAVKENTSVQQKSEFKSTT